MNPKRLYFDINVASLQEGFNHWPHSPHYKALNLIRANTNVLDVGCAKGYMAEELNKLGCQVTGIEKDHQAALLARKHCQQVIEQDIENLESLPLEQGYFDYIICLDVLEHLSRPDVLLTVLRKYLSSEGELIVSIPNIARFEHRLALLFGNFNYSEYGAISKGHLRFFTRKTSSELLEGSGFIIKKIEPTGLGSIIRIFTNLTAFQFILVAKKQ
ncbi:MAG: class I SAM-dependent methyltransferase [Candidatus Omnitrophica bacterium]|nr:class I SAM-dependent methyltransferase [Candidatus Omnitrophota bacterium]